MLQLILGRSGYGKTEYVFNSIKELVCEKNEQVLLITPEQYSFIAERRLLSDLGESKISNVQNMSFSRLCTDILNMYGGNSLPVLSKGAKAVMMKKAINTVRDSLVLFGKSIIQNSFVNSFISIYDEMKSCRVSTNDILSASKEVDKKVLADKLNDISLIIDAYDALIANKYLDPATELTRRYEQIVDKDYFAGKTVFIDGFNGFVAQEYKILEVIIKQAKMVYITFCTNPNDEIDNDRFNLFYYVNRNISILTDVARSANVTVLDPVLLKAPKRFNSDNLVSLEKNIYSNKAIEHSNNANDISVYSAKSIYDECDNTANNISELLRQGYKASDIAVICRDLEQYEQGLEFAFNKYNVPYFDDERQSIASQPIIMLVNFLLRTVIYSLRSEDIFSMLKTGLTELNYDEISILENYTYTWSINGSKWNKPFENSPRGFVDNMTEGDIKALKSINKYREYVSKNIDSFKSRIKDKTCKSICKAIYYSLIDFKCDEGLKALAISLDNDGKSALAEEQGRVWDLLMNVLDDLVSICGDEKLTLKEFYSIFNLMITNEDLGMIPTGLDNIQIGSANRIRCNNPKVVFVLGANEGIFPQSVSSAGLLSEKDRVALINNNFKLYSYGEILNAQEKYFAYMAVTCATDKLFVSFVSDSAESSILTEIKLIFPKITFDTFNYDIGLSKLQSNENAFEILSSNYNYNTEFIASLKEYFKSNDAYSSRLNAVDNIVNNNELTINNKDIAVDLFKKDMYLSASKIEKYFNCSFQYFCKYGLSAKPRQKAELDPMQSGIIIHYVLENIVKEHGKDGLIELTHSQIVSEVNRHLNEFMISSFGNANDLTSRFKYQYLRLSKMLVIVIERLCNEFKNSDFAPKAFELKIGKNNEPVKSKKIELADGGSIAINGSIDRVDTFVENGVQYTRVVDYKSGTKKFKLSDIVYGLNLQMFIYLFNLCESDNELAGINSGVLYLHSSKSISNIDRNPENNELEKNQDKDFKMIGVVLNDDNHEIAQHMERDLKGKYIPVKYTAKNGVYGDIVTLAQLGAISKKIDSLIAQMGLNLHNGKIEQNPVNSKSHDKTCEHCDYADVCKNRIEITPRDIDDLSNDEVFNLLKEVE